LHGKFIDGWMAGMAPLLKQNLLGKVERTNVRKKISHKAANHMGNIVRHPSCVSAPLGARTANDPGRYAITQRKSHSHRITVPAKRVTIMLQECKTRDGKREMAHSRSGTIDNLIPAFEGIKFEAAPADEPIGRSSSAHSGSTDTDVAVCGCSGTGI
jgi:hypothetical protein